MISSIDKCVEKGQNDFVCLFRGELDEHPFYQLFSIENRQGLEALPNSHGYMCLVSYMSRCFLLILYLCHAKWRISSRLRSALGGPGSDSWPVAWGGIATGNLPLCLDQRLINVGGSKTVCFHHLVGGLEYIFPYVGNNHTNWLIFFKIVKTTNQSCVFSHTWDDWLTSMLGIGYMLKPPVAHCELQVLSSSDPQQRTRDVLLQPRDPHLAVVEKPMEHVA